MSAELRPRRRPTVPHRLRVHLKRAYLTFQIRNTRCAIVDLQSRMSAWPANEHEQLAFDLAQLDFWQQHLEALRRQRSALV